MSDTKYYPNVDEIPLESPITSQPSQSQVPPAHYAAVTIPVNVPPGLEPLLYLSTLIVQQKREWLEILCNFESNNVYKIRNILGQDLYVAKEETGCLTRTFCGPARPFDIAIRDSNDREVIHISRPFAWGCVLCNCSLYTVTVESPPGVVIGTVEQLGGAGNCTPKFCVRNPEGQVALWVEGQDCGYCCHFCTVSFNLLSADRGMKVGEIQKRWGGLAREIFTDADSFGISFPPDLDVRMKGVLLGVLFLIDFMFFEQTKRNY